MRLARLLPVLPAALLLLLPCIAKADSPVHTVNALALLGEPKYGSDFKYFDWVNPNAPKGGELHVSADRQFRHLQSVFLQGRAGRRRGRAVRDPDGAEPERAGYRIRASRRIRRHSRRQELGRLQPAARGALPGRQTGHRRGRRLHLQHPARPRAIRNTRCTTPMSPRPKRSARSRSSSPSRTIPIASLSQILGQLPVLPKHYWESKDFEATTLVPPLGSGPYKIDTFELAAIRRLSAAIRTTGAGQAAGQGRAR